MAVEVVMPKLGLTMTTATVVKWLKKEGDFVNKKEDLLEIMTEKVSYTVESPAEGFLLKILANENSEHPSGALLCYLGAQGEHIGEVAGGAASVEEKDVSGSELAGRSPVEEGGSGPAGTVRKGEKVKISPLALKIAKDLNVDYTAIAGSGPGGRITREDVERFAAAREALAEQKAGLPPPPPVSGESSFDLIPYAGMRKLIGDNMGRSWTLAAKVTHHVSVDVLKLTGFRKMINEGLQDGEPRVSFTDLLVKIVASALKLKPNINVSLDGDNIKMLKEINIGVAVALETGLVVPVVRNVIAKDVLQISRELRELVSRARAGRLSMEDMSMGTFTITNLGAYGSVDFFTPIINQPESAILGVGRIVDTPVVVDGEIAIRPMMGLSLSFDHRIIDGAPAAQFLAVLIRLLSNPARAVVESG